MSLSSWLRSLNPFVTRQSAKRERRSGAIAPRTTALLLEELEDRTLLSISTWDGGGGDFSWQNPLNWSNDTLPSIASDVVIDVIGDVTITHSNSSTSIHNLTSQKAIVLSGGSLTVAAGVTVNNTFTVSGGTLSVGGDWNVAGKFEQTAGSTVLTGGSLLAGGGVVIAGGVLSGSGTVNGDVVNAGHLSPGAGAGTFNINGAYTQTATGTLDIEIGGLAAGIQFDQLQVSGSTTLSGALNVSLIDGFAPVAGDRFQVLEFDDALGDFSTKTGLDLADGQLLAPRYGGDGLSLLSMPPLTETNLNAKNITADSAEIEWVTNVPSTSRVVYESTNGSAPVFSAKPRG